MIRKPIPRKLGAAVAAATGLLAAGPAVAGAYTAYVSGWPTGYDQNLALLDTETKRVYDWMAVGDVDERGQVAVTPNGRYLLVLNSDKLWIFSTRTQELVASRSVDRSYEMEIRPGGGEVYVAGQGDYVRVLDISSPEDGIELSASINVSAELVEDIKFSPTGEEAYVSVVVDMLDGDRVAKIDAGTQTVERSRHVVHAPLWFDVSADGEYLYLTSAWDESLRSVKTDDLTVQSTVELTSESDDYPADVVADPSSPSYVYVLLTDDWQSWLMKVQAGAYAPVVARRTELGGGAHSMALDPDGTRGYITLDDPRGDGDSLTVVSIPDAAVVDDGIDGIDSPSWVAVAPPPPPVIEIDPRDLLERTRSIIESWRDRGGWEPPDWEPRAPRAFPDVQLPGGWPRTR